jgi:hypothetical protein
MNNRHVCGCSSRYTVSPHWHKYEQDFVVGFLSPMKVVLAVTMEFYYLLSLSFSFLFEDDLPSLWLSKCFMDFRQNSLFTDAMLSVNLSFILTSDQEGSIICTSSSLQTGKLQHCSHKPPTITSCLLPMKGICTYYLQLSHACTFIAWKSVFKHADKLWLHLYVRYVGNIRSKIKLAQQYLVKTSYIK